MYPYSVPIKFYRTKISESRAKLKFGDFLSKKGKKIIIMEDLHHFANM